MWVQRRLRSAWVSTQSDQSSMSSWRKLGSLATHWVHSEDSDQTDLSLRWVHSHFVGFVMRWLKWFTSERDYTESSKKQRRLKKPKYLKKTSSFELASITMLWQCWESNLATTVANKHFVLGNLCASWNSLFVCLCWGLTSQSTIFQSCRDGATASWVINQYFRGVKCLAQGHNTAAAGIEPPTSRSGVRHSTTEPPRSPSWNRNCILLEQSSESENLIKTV